jgi:leucyl-tRNA synthetase
MRFKLELPAGISKDEIQSIVMAHDKTKQYIGDQKPKRIIIIPNKIINIVF